MDVPALRAVAAASALLTETRHPPSRDGDTATP